MTFWVIFPWPAPADGCKRVTVVQLLESFHGLHSLPQSLSLRVPHAALRFKTASATVTVCVVANSITHLPSFRSLLIPPVI